MPPNPKIQSPKPASPDAGAETVGQTTTIRVPNYMRDVFSGIAAQQDVPISEVVWGHYQFYQGRMRYNFVVEVSDLVPEIQAVEESLAVNAKLMLEISEAVRRLVELKETGLLNLAERLKNELR